MGVVRKEMKLQWLKSHSPLTPYAPSWSYAIGHTHLPLNVNELSKTCLSKEKEIKKLPLTKIGDEYYDGYTGLGTNSTTSRSDSYNVLNWDTSEVRSLRKYIRINIERYNEQVGNPTPDKLWIQCWLNILRWGQKIDKHLHTVRPDCYLSAHYTVQCNKTSTCYINPVNVLNDPIIIERENEVNEFTLFPSCMPHYTTKHYALTPRITLAMDISITPQKSLSWMDL